MQKFQPIRKQTMKQLGGISERNENHNVKDHSITISAESGPKLVKESWEKNDRNVTS